ncbi:MAG: class I SAM-dependent rRNA methyltransferase [Vicinamibacterales bacterium]
MRLAAVVLPDRALDRLVRASDLPFTLAPPDGDLADGAIVRLESRRGAAIGLAIVDRTDGCWRVMTRAGEPWPSLGDTWLDARLANAAAWRDAAAVTGPDATYRLVNGAGDGLPGLYVDVYGGFAVVAALSPALLPVAAALARRLVARDLLGVVVKHRRRGAAARHGEVVHEIVGTAPPDRVIVREGPWRFEVHLAAGVNVGLFGDMRAERLRLAGLAAGRRVLNLFAYTGTLSVACATGGATAVTSVDLSEGVLAWARDNAALNEVPAGRHRTEASDARRFVSAASTRGDSYDLVLIDPPSFSAARDAAFAVDRDYPGLIAEACRLVVPGGLAWLAVNTRGFSLVGAAQVGTAAAGRRAQVMAVGLLPPDHPTELADADARYLQTCLLRLS